MLSRDDDALEALVTAGRRLLELDRDRFDRVLQLAEVYVSIYDGADIGEAALMSLTGRRRGAA